MERKFNWCFIGTGKLAKKVAKQLIATKRHDVVSCFTRNFEKGQLFASKLPNCKAYEKVIDAINDPNVDGVYIVTPHNAHFRYARIALINKKPVFVEKPFTVTFEEANELVNLSKESDTYLAEAMWTWYGSTGYNMKNAIFNDNAIGEIKSADLAFRVKSYNPNTRIGDPKRAGGALLDLGVYPITYAYRLFGLPEKIEANAKIENGCDLRDEIKFIYKDGFIANITCSVIDSFKERVTVVGTEGKVTCGFFIGRNGFKLKKGLKTKTIKEKGPMMFNYTREFDITVDEIRKGNKESSKVTLNDTLVVMKLMDQIREIIGLKYENLE